MNKLAIYQGGPAKVAVYDTYADGRRIHFDVFLRTDRGAIQDVPQAEDERALAVARKFLEAIGESADTVVITRCRRCHIDSTEAYAGQLWDLTDALIWPIDGCPKPRP